MSSHMVIGVYQLCVCVGGECCPNCNILIVEVYNKIPPGLRAVKLLPIGLQKLNTLMTSFTHFITSAISASFEN